MFGVRLSKMGSASKLGLIAKAIGILRKYGTDAHIYLPGVGTVNGITAGNYLDSAGVTAATVDNPVGLSLDALQAMTLGSEKVTNGNFAGGSSGWTLGAGWSVSGGFGVKTAGTASYLEYPAANAAYVGEAVQVKFTISGMSAGQFLITYGAATGPVVLANGSYTQTVFAAAIGSGVGYWASFYGDAGFNGSITNISIKQIHGIHATQATTANKPILRRGLLNQALYSNDITNAAYSLDMSGAALPVVTANAGIDPSGNLTADRLVLNKTGGAFSRIAQSVVASVGQPYTMAVWMKTYAGGTANVGIRLDSTGSNQLVTSAWTLSAISATATIGATSAQILLFDSIIGNDETADILVGGMGLFQGTYTAQQIIDAGGIPLTTSAAASSATGKYWWQFDGSNDSLSLSAPLFQMSDDHCVIAGARCAKATGTPQAVISPSRDASNGNTLGRLQFDASGTVSAVWTPTGGPVIITSPTSLVGITKVLTAYKTGNTKNLRIDGVLIGSDSTPQTDAGMTSAAISDYRTGLQLPFEGALYPVIAIKGTVTDGDLLTLERFVGQLSGVTGI